MDDLARHEGPPAIALHRLFLRFLRFGSLAWGGPVAQIAMIRHELVDKEHWISPGRFNRVLAVYQVLPGPEAHELCVYFGMLAGGRPGAFLAGLGFMLPGFLLMLGLSWFYVAHGISSVFFSALLFGFQPAVMALIVRAIHRIGGHALTDRWLWLIAVVSAVLQWLGVNFLIILALAGGTYSVIRGTFPVKPSTLPVLAIFPICFFPSGAILAVPGTVDLFISGLKAGLLTFGGAYTVIPFLQHDAVVAGAWMTNSQFLDGLALSGILPAPLVIFATFVGYLGSGWSGALCLTAGVFLPAFAFTMVGHSLIERLVENKSLHAFLDGVGGVCAPREVVRYQWPEHRERRLHFDQFHRLPHDCRHGIGELRLHRGPFGKLCLPPGREHVVQCLHVRLKHRDASLP